MFRKKIKSILPSQILAVFNLDAEYIQKRELKNNVRIVESLNIRANTAMFEILIRESHFPLGRREELYSLQQIVSDRNDGNGLYALEERKRTSEVLARYLQISSIEGQGSYFYDVKTDRIFDCGWGEEEWMLEGTKAAMFETSMAFFTWYYSKPNKIHRSEAIKHALFNFNQSKQPFSQGYNVHYWLGQKMRRLSYHDQQSIELAFEEKLVEAVNSDLG